MELVNYGPVIIMDNDVIVNWNGEFNGVQTHGMDFIYSFIHVFPYNVLY